MLVNPGWGGGETKASLWTKARGWVLVKVNPEPHLHRGPFDQQRAAPVAVTLHPGRPPDRKQERGELVGAATNLHERRAGGILQGGGWLHHARDVQDLHLGLRVRRERDADSNPPALPSEPPANLGRGSDGDAGLRRQAAVRPRKCSQL